MGNGLMGVNKYSLGKRPRQQMVCNARCHHVAGPVRAQAPTTSRLWEGSPELGFVTVLEWPRISQLSGKNSKLAGDGGV